MREYSWEGVFAFSVWGHHHSADSQINNCLKNAAQRVLWKVNMHKKGTKKTQNQQQAHVGWCQRNYIHMINIYIYTLWNSSLVFMFWGSLKCMLHLVSKLLFPLPPQHIILSKGLQVISSRYCYSSGPSHSYQILLTHPHPSIPPSQMTVGESCGTHCERKQETRNHCTSVPPTCSQMFKKHNYVLFPLNESAFIVHFFGTKTFDQNGVKKQIFNTQQS